HVGVPSLYFATPYPLAVTRRAMVEERLTDADYEGDPPCVVRLPTPGWLAGATLDAHGHRALTGQGRVMRQLPVPCHASPARTAARSGTAHSQGRMIVVYGASPSLRRRYMPT